jgi:hypothetical protein
MDEELEMIEEIDLEETIDLDDFFEVLFPEAPHEDS